MMMAVSLAVRRDMNQLVRFAVVRKHAREAIRELDAIVEQPLEGHGARNRAIVKENGDGAAVGRLNTVGPPGIDARARDVLPCLGTDRAHQTCLRGSEEREKNS